MRIGVGAPGDRQVQYLGSDLRAGDEIAIRVLDDDQPTDDQVPEACSFCGTNIHDIQSLVSGPRVSICNGCTAAFNAAAFAGT